MGDPNFFIQANKTTKFIVKNITSDRKTITLFDYPIEYGRTRDLLSIPAVSESDIRNSLLKGDLLKKLKINEIQIIFSNINLLQSDEEHRQFLLTSGIIGGGNIASICIVSNLDELRALSTIDLQDNCKITVESVGDSFILKKDSDLTLVPFVIEAAAAEGSQWIRAMEPVQWAFQPTWYIDSINGDDENLGITEASPLQTLDEFKRRINPSLGYTGQTLVCYILNDITDDFAITMKSIDFGNFVENITFDGSLGKTELASFTLSEVVPADPATQQEYKIKATGVSSWASYVGKIAFVTTGASTSARFAILKDLGSGYAQISQVGFGEYDGTAMEILPGDEFTVYQFPQFGGEIVFSGGVILLNELQAGGQFTHSLIFNNSTVFIEACNMFDCDSHSASISITNSIITASVRSYANGDIVLWSGGAIGNSIVHKNGNITFSDYTMFGPIRAGDRGGSYLIELGWLGIFDCTTAINISNIQALTMSDGYIFGKNISGPKIKVYPGGKFFYTDGNVPNIAGTGVDVNVGGTDLTFDDIPFFNPDNGAVIAAG
jgi:hypothetical protein